MIKNIIFDFGDIFINLDKSATARAMAKHGFKGLTPELDQLFKTYEKGLVGSGEFLQKVGKLFPTAHERELIDAWNAILLDFPPYRLKFLERLFEEKRHRLFLLSNTNEIHIKNEQQKMGEAFERFKSCFEGFHLSYEMKMRKPDSEIFEFVLNENGLDPTETFFIDDTKENIEAAAGLGIKTWHLQVGEQDVVQLDQFMP
ncbi:HAD family hydrolase [Allomuricauda sp. SCSIO 65647]|uniref:HAD family hydrolase n=1 Tax=Allomuricauda sp. SCSIO 65647 TaxID=2908843 RepID=UPI001F47FDCA|nr:HAD family phosphatase [Muricauda sp. SCSIO 65647]UJH67615.1 HAD family phosphatase [Muricauda sp. SCSIO 65647]